MELPGVAHRRVQPTASQTPKEPVPLLRLTDSPAITEPEKARSAAKGHLEGNVRLEALRRRVTRISGDSWTWELIGIFVCCGALVSILSLLLTYNHKPLPNSVAGISVSPPDYVPYPSR